MSQETQKTVTELTTKKPALPAIKKQLNVEAVINVNVYGKSLKYIIIGEGEQKCVISVGDKTHQQVWDLCNMK